VQIICTGKAPTESIAAFDVTPLEPPARYRYTRALGNGSSTATENWTVSPSAASTSLGYSRISGVEAAGAPRSIAAIGPAPAFSAASMAVPTLGADRVGSAPFDRSNRTMASLPPITAK